MKEGKGILYVVDISLYGSFLENWNVLRWIEKAHRRLYPNINEYDNFGL
jgi:hypothetical protein